MNESKNQDSTVGSSYEDKCIHPSIHSSSLKQNPIFKMSVGCATKRFTQETSILEVYSRKFVGISLLLVEVYYYYLNREKERGK